jgi:hypothetical protein
LSVDSLAALRTNPLFALPLTQFCTAEVTGKSTQAPSVFAFLVAVPATGPPIPPALFHVAVAGLQAALACNACIATFVLPVVKVWS